MFRGTARARAVIPAHAKPGGEVRALRLHLGCGGNAPEGWLNVDKSFGPVIERLRIKHLLCAIGVLTPAQASWRWPTNVVRLDITREWPWPDSSAEAIYSSHMVEHFTPAEMRRFLDKSYRVLRPGGILRLAVPDLEFVVVRYIRGRDDGRPNAADDLNRLFYSMPDSRSGPLLHRLAIALLHRPHQWMYDFRSMADRMERAGFTQVARFSCAEGRLPQVELLDVRPRSLFIEGVRP